MKSIFLLLKKIIRIWLLLTNYQKIACWNVFTYSIYNKILLILNSRLAYCEYYKSKELKDNLTEEKMQIAKDISLAIYLVNQIVPWENVCRHQSWQAINILSKYNIPYTYHTGFKQIENGSIIGHSWIIVNNFYICGDKELSNSFKEINFNK